MLQKATTPIMGGGIGIPVVQIIHSHKTLLGISQEEREVEK